MSAQFEAIKVRLSDNVAVGRWQYTYGWLDFAQQQAEVLNACSAHRGAVLEGLGRASEIAYEWRAVEVCHLFAV